MLDGTRVLVENHNQPFALFHGDADGFHHLEIDSIDTYASHRHTSEISDHCHKANITTGESPTFFGLHDDPSVVHDPAVDGKGAALLDGDSRVVGEGDGTVQVGDLAVLHGIVRGKTVDGLGLGVEAAEAV